MASGTTPSTARTMPSARLKRPRPSSPPAARASLAPRLQATARADDRKRQMAAARADLAVRQASHVLRRAAAVPCRHPGCVAPMYLTAARRVHPPALPPIHPPTPATLVAPSKGAPTTSAGGYERCLYCSGWVTGMMVRVVYGVFSTPGAVHVVAVTPPMLIVQLPDGSRPRVRFDEVIRVVPALRVLCTRVHDLQGGPAAALPGATAASTHLVARVALPELPAARAPEAVGAAAPLNVALRTAARAIASASAVLAARAADFTLVPTYESNTQEPALHCGGRQLDGSGDEQGDGGSANTPLTAAELSLHGDVGAGRCTDGVSNIPHTVWACSVCRVWLCKDCFKMEDVDGKGHPERWDHDNQCLLAREVVCN